MGAYSNPETFIDTQSAQSYQRLQDTISGTFANIAQSYAAKQKEIKNKLEENAKILKANDMKAQEYAFSLYTDLSKSGQSDPTVDWAKTYEPLINEAVKIRSGMLNGTLEDKQGAMKRLGQIQGSVDNVTSSLATLSAAGTGYLNNISKGYGVQGGAASSNDPSVTSALDVLTQRIPGTKEVIFKDNDPTKLIWVVKDKDGKLLHEFDADQLKKISQGNGLIRMVPNQIAEFDKLKSTNSNIFETIPVKPGEKGDPMPTGQINPQFLVKQNGKPKVIVNNTKAPDGTIVTTYTQEVDINAIKIDDNFNTTITAQAEGLLKANQSSAIDFYNDIIVKPQGRWSGLKNMFDPNKPLSEEEKKKFIEDYKEYYISTQIMPTQPLLRPDPDQVTFIDRAEKTKKAAANAEDKKDKKESIDSVVKRVWNTKKGKFAEFTYGGRKVSYDGGNFLVERTAGLKDLVFKTKEDVINYLKTGSAEKPNP